MLCCVKYVEDKFKYTQQICPILRKLARNRSEGVPPARIILCLGAMGWGLAKLKNCSSGAAGVVRDKHLKNIYKLYKPYTNGYTNCCETYTNYTNC